MTWMRSLCLVLGLVFAFASPAFACDEPDDDNTGVCVVTTVRGCDGCLYIDVVHLNSIAPDFDINQVEITDDCPPSNDVIKPAEIKDAGWIDGTSTLYQGNNPPAEVEDRSSVVPEWVKTAAPWCYWYLIAGLCLVGFVLPTDQTSDHVRRFHLARGVSRGKH